MKRVEEKVKDIVEICPFISLNDFAADSAMTLAGYHFTDITSDLMAKWLDRISDVRPGQGAALALAGFRGVGKSHFMAAMAAIVARPDLRSRILDQHVIASAGRLSRRHGPVAFVRRGTGSSLLDELKQSIAQMFDVSPAKLSDSLYDLLLSASNHAGEMPLVLLVDTAPGRETRVARDDGILLSQIADIAKSLGIFVGVALDDDISGADGPNSSIVGTFNIDYLDQEHLYKIVDAYIFSKRPQKLPVLHDIYEYYREVLPGFRWSEQRFSSLYPLHPATLEIAPLIRLYIHDFALLGFAAEAGEKILGRPANSLIGLDEVFHSVEARLRNVQELQQAFSAFDQLEQDVVAKVPVQFRLPAKLVLKGLLVLSLNGQGSTPSEIAASMMIFDEDQPGSATLDVAKLLESFAEAIPERIEKTGGSDDAAKFGFKMVSAGTGGDLLAEAVKDVTDDVVWSILLRQTAEKYSDVEVSSEFGTHPTNCSVEWRRAIRRGAIIWNPNEIDTSNANDLFDWTVRVEKGGKHEVVDHGGPQEVVWRISDLTADEKNTVRRHHLLQTDSEVRGQFGEGLMTAVHVNSIAVEKIWQRVFLRDSSLLTAERSYEFTEEALSAHTLAQLFTVMLAPAFDAKYASHPEFARLLDRKRSSSLITDFFSGQSATNPETQSLAETFAVPLGLAVRHGDQLVPVAAEVLTELPAVKLVIEGSKKDSDRVIPLTEIAFSLQAPPVGLTRESQHLVLAALVAQREFEFITSSGNRINHRSLDLQIVWDDIIGISRPLSEEFSTDRLLLWAKLITGNSGLGSLDRSEDRLLIIDSLSGWLAGWKESRVLADFDALPDEHLNAAIWRTAANLRKSLGAMADSIEGLIKNDITLDHCIHEIAELFSDSESEFENKKNDLRVLRDFIVGVSRRSEISNYLSLCELTGDAETEEARHHLLGAICSDHFNAAAAASGEIEKMWTGFHASYSNHYADKHDTVMMSPVSGDALKGFLSSDEWAVFESFSNLPWFDQRYASAASGLVREMRQLYCESNTRMVLGSRPFCTCSFSLAKFDRLSSLPDHLKKIVDTGLGTFRTTLRENSKKLVGSAETDAIGAALKQILGRVESSETLSGLSSEDVRLLVLAIERTNEIDPNITKNARHASDDLANMLPGSAAEWDHEVERLELFANTDR